MEWRPEPFDSSKDRSLAFRSHPHRFRDSLFGLGANKRRMGMSGYSIGGAAARSETLPQWLPQEKRGQVNHCDRATGERRIDPLKLMARSTVIDAAKKGTPWRADGRVGLYTAPRPQRRHLAAKSSQRWAIVPIARVAEPSSDSLPGRVATYQRGSVGDVVPCSGAYKGLQNAQAFRCFNRLRWPCYARSIHRGREYRASCAAHVTPLAVAAPRSCSKSPAC
jgi:hypothetical protein